MIEFYTGVPGAGKTVKAVSYILNNFSLNAKKEQRYTAFYTNINSFDFSKVRGGNPLTYSSIFSHISFLFSIKDADDSFLIDYCKDHNIYNVLFVIDEAHVFFPNGKKDEQEVIRWWFSYHRHLHHDILVITQNLSLLDRKILNFGEFFYKATQPSMRFFNNFFSYKKFINFKMYRTHLVDTITLKPTKELFALYTSGQQTNTKKVIYKFVGIFFFFILFAFLVFYFFAISKNKKDDINGTVSSSSQSYDLNITYKCVCFSSSCSCGGKELSTQELLNYAHKYHLFNSNTFQTHKGVFMYTFKGSKQFQMEVLNVQSSSFPTR